MANINDFILGKGEDARKKNEEKPMTRKKTIYVKLKDGESIRGFLLTTEFVMYMAHGDFNKRIKTHTCKDPKNGKDCLSCRHGVKRSKKTIVPFYNVDTKQVEIFDASPTAMKAVYSFVDQYEEEATTTPVVLTRSGDDTKTTYTLMPVRVKAAEKALFEVPESVKIDDEFYEGVLNIPDDEYVRQLIGLDEEDEEVKDLGNESEEGLDDLPF